MIPSNGIMKCESIKLLIMMQCTGNIYNKKGKGTPKRPENPEGFEV
jgi:hypothetical protein